MSVVLVLVGLPEVGQDIIAVEDAGFRAFLEANGYDTRQMGARSAGDVETGEAGEAAGIVVAREKETGVTTDAEVTGETAEAVLVPENPASPC